MFKTYCWDSFPWCFFPIRFCFCVMCLTFLSHVTQSPAYLRAVHVEENFPHPSTYHTFWLSGRSFGFCLCFSLSFYDAIHSSFHVPQNLALSSPFTATGYESHHALALLIR
jgi:hypothetical protein